jgi:hypothetical protein
MRKILQVLTILILAGSTVSAQWVTDSISMGPNYADNIFYKFGSGIQKTSSSSNWHIALSMNALDSASVFANQKGSLADFVKVYNIHKPIADWSSVNLSDTLNAGFLYNGDDGWYQGAFNQIPNPSAFNYGWGTYNISSHKITGDSVFIVRTGNGFYKLAIDSLNPLTYDWNMRVEQIDVAGMTQTYSVSKSNGYADRLFAYFDLDNAQTTDREPDVNSWDMQFITYPTYVFAGPNSSYRGVTGALTNRGIPVAEASMIDLDDARNDYQNAPSPSWQAGWESNAYSTIGYDWKSFNLGTFQYDILDSLSYFVKSQSDSVFQMQFLEFPGGTTGNIKFRYRYVGAPVSVNDIQPFAKPSIFPNPASDQINILFNATISSPAELNIMDMSGRVVYKTTKKVNNGLNVWTLNTASFPAGHYVIRLGNDEAVVQQKMTLSK